MISQRKIRRRITVLRKRRSRNPLISPNSRKTLPKIRQTAFKIPLRAILQNRSHRKNHIKNITAVKIRIYRKMRILIFPTHQRTRIIISMLKNPISLLSVRSIKQTVIHKRLIMQILKKSPQRIRLRKSNGRKTNAYSRNSVYRRTIPLHQKQQRTFPTRRSPKITQRIFGLSVLKKLNLRHKRRMISLIRQRENYLTKRKSSVSGFMTRKNRSRKHV